MAANLAAARSKVWHAIIGATTFGLLIIAFAFSQWYTLSLLLVFLIGLSNQVYMTTRNTIQQMTQRGGRRGW